MWEYCTPSKLDMDETPAQLDEGDKMRLDDCNTSMGFYLQFKTLKTSQDEINMELGVFNYFVSRDMI